MFQNIVIVCTANICRSPMAEAVLGAKLLHKGCIVTSAGTRALAGEEAARYTQEILSEHGYDISRHRARQANESILKSSDLILTVDATHTSWIVQNFPYLRGRVHKLGKWRQNADIADPYGMPKEAFAQTYELIEGCAQDWAAQVSGTQKETS